LEEKSKSLVAKFVTVPTQKSSELAAEKIDNQNILKKFEDEFSKYRDKYLIQPIMRVVSTLPKEEMA
jgi:hypothetical protein